MRSILVLLGIGTACAACCVPFLAPALAAIGVSGVLATRIGGVSLEYVVCEAGPWISAAAAIALAATLTIWVVRRRRTHDTCNCAATCTPGEC